MRPIVEVTLSCQVDGCHGRVHVHGTRRRGPLIGACDACGTVTTVDLTASEPLVGRPPAPLLVGAAS